MSKGRNEILKREREQRGWSQARLAELIGTDAATVSRWERGYATPSPYFREHLCRLFEKSAQDLGLLPEKQAESEQKPSPFSTLHRVVRCEARWQLRGALYAHNFQYPSSGRAL